MENKMKEFLEHLKKVDLLNSASGLLGWDQNVNLPPKGIQSRSETQALLHSISYDMFVSKETEDFINALENVRENLTDIEKTMLDETKKDFLKTKAVPKELFEKRTKLTVSSQLSWQKAREENNFSLFESNLKDILDVTKEIAEIYREKIYPELNNGYEALMTEFEPGMKSEKIKEINADLQPFLTDLIEKIGDKGNSEILKGKYGKDEQLEVSRFAIEKFGYDFEGGRMDLSTHPFTTGYALGDVRLTTRVDENDFTDCFYSALHEGGHAIYEQGLPEKYAWTPIHAAASFGIHESQSRLWENNVGRSREFIKFIHPHLKKAFPGRLEVSDEELYAAINKVSPSFIRTEADEVTYNLHIMLRFEIEIALFENKIKVSELPEAWNDLMQKYLGITPPNNSVGVLQDVHWSWGMFGYFPSYMLGNLYAAQIFNSIEKNIPNLKSEIENGSFSNLKKWLNENIHSKGKMFTPDILMEKATGETLNTTYFKNYLKNKYLGN